MATKMDDPSSSPKEVEVLPLNDKKARAAAKKARKEARRAQRRADAEASSRVADELGLPSSAVNLAAAASVARRPLTEIPPNLRVGAVTICLCYQYREPAWTSKQHNVALHSITQMATKHGVTGRGRVAPEGINFTLTSSAQGMRDFCNALRDWDPMFWETDFKLTDNCEPNARFRFFTPRKVEELVAYGLEGVKAPSLKHHSGKHLEAHEYHKQMQQKDTVIIDVRNAYESDIGHFQPPPGGATLLKPQMRNSLDFPKWLNAPETKEQISGKTVMMYCTGGIRCERATALLNQMTEADNKVDADSCNDNGNGNGGGFHTKDVVMVRGGIERYLKTFPEGGYWKGSNYLFDQRREQVPEEKPSEQLEKEIDSYCCVCLTKHAQYRGQHRCGQILATGLPCNVPVIVCDHCQDKARQTPKTLTCPLCAQGYQIPEEVPDLVGQKRKLGVINEDGLDHVTGKALGDGPTTKKRSKKDVVTEPARRLFVGKLPLTITASALREALRRAARSKNFVNNKDAAVVSTIQWIVDHKTQAFYGSAYCEMESIESAKAVMEAVRTKGGGLLVGPCLKSRKKRQKIRPARVNYCPIRQGETWPSKEEKNRYESEYPPLGIV